MYESEEYRIDLESSWLNAFKLLYASFCKKSSYLLLVEPKPVLS